MFFSQCSARTPGDAYNNAPGSSENSRYVILVRVSRIIKIKNKPFGFQHAKSIGETSSLGICN